MSTYFVFSDSAGNFKSRSGTCTHKYYVQAALLFDSVNWKDCIKKRNSLRTQKGIPEDKEIKWSYIWSLCKHRKNNESIPSEKPYYFLKNISHNVLLSYINDTLSLLGKCSGSRVIINVTDNSVNISCPRNRMYEMHLENLMERVEMEMKNNSIAAFFFDGEKGLEKHLRDAYHSLYIQPTFIKGHRHIKDSICFEDSQHSMGVEFVDYIAGITNCTLKKNQESKNLFIRYIKPLLCKKNNSGEILGYGVKEVPANTNVRNKLSQLLNLRVTAEVCS